MINKLTFISKLKPANQQLIKDSAIFVKIKRDSILFNQGDICNSILFITKGRAKLIRQNEAKSILLFYFSSGEQCNVNFINNDTMPAIGTGIATTDIEGYRVPSNIVREIFIQDEEFQKYIFQQYADRILYMANLVEEVRFKRLDLRLIEWLKMQDSNVIFISHEELSDILGTSREVISRILKTLESDNLVKLHRKKIEILESLRAI
ncbi:Crp/Fnr family transcriptional regulator [Helicobacter sp. 16-1353]|uniref:Crp/Fnr family transcriptional regulator n=1 Tax=Helicobacter sp. 16-1353 TaxID=2004996 RepID=UPI000DCC3317|nr:Crp/Fnr family transcriptional regulator [Helicobacter sp. 16-1353]RAX55247.1 Crp/Fnr family transcriptional regulator [Helicobacter sp. 16-1353]